MSSTARFSLTRATEADLPEICKLCWVCFPQIVRDLVMGCPTEEDLPKLVDHFGNMIREHHHAVWLKVVENSTGKIAAAALWKIYPNAGAPASGDELPPPWLVGETREKSKGLLDTMNAERRKANPDGFLHLHICFTGPDYRRQGAARLLMQWGCDVADALSVPAWIEASTEGNPLYKCYGFFDVGEMQGVGTFMKREAKTMLREGGRSL
ncbi:hypothetical protein VSDG_03581 [Cytospora chrysosperma]|uniref:N-acetyltransferase domain-containing protein n=1 Tax=Cytospora chrysosperma TaxID=252740 RepID=A0A423WA20_CYTCH|nr:hypothetical protein VSDG_03581 [Valsa sordida]